MFNRQAEGRTETTAAEDSTLHEEPIQAADVPEAIDKPSISQTDSELVEDDEPFFTVTMPEATAEQRLAIYMVYREMGGRPYEPTESLYREHTATAQQPDRALSPAPRDTAALPTVHAS